MGMTMKFDYTVKGLKFSDQKFFFKDYNKLTGEKIIHIHKLALLKTMNKYLKKKKKFFK